jgi:uncharacterized protein DUF1538
MKKQLLALLASLRERLRDLIPIIVVVAFFQWVVLRQPLPDIGSVLSGVLFVLIGLNLFVHGLEMGLFPIGESMAYAFARKGSLFWLLLFAFSFGFGATVAEPALIAVAGEAGKVAAQGGLIANAAESSTAYALGLRLTVALAVGVALVLGVLRILKGWPIQFMLAAGYLSVITLTPFAPRWVVGVAYDCGGVTTSTITAPLVAALGVGLASSIKGRNPVLDGFGLIAFASLTPIIFVLTYGIWLGGNTP